MRVSLNYFTSKGIFIKSTQLETDKTNQADIFEEITQLKQEGRLPHILGDNFIVGASCHELPGRTPQLFL